MKAKLSNKTFCSKAERFSGKNLVQVCGVAPTGFPTIHPCKAARHHHPALLLISYNIILIYINAINAILMLLIYINIEHYKNQAMRTNTDLCILSISVTIPSKKNIPKK